MENMIFCRSLLKIALEKCSAQARQDAKRIKQAD
jgi:hypothetical protein